MDIIMRDDEVDALNEMIWQELMEIWNPWVKRASALS